MTAFRVVGTKCIIITFIGQIIESGRSLKTIVR